MAINLSEWGPKMNFSKILVAVIAAVSSNFAAAQTQWPAKPYRIIIGYPQGGAMDLIVRLGAERIQAKSGQALILESRTGASGHLATEQVFKAAPDGYTLMVAPPAFVTTPFMFAELPFNPDTMVPISLLASQPNVIAVNPGRLPDVHTLQQLIDRARANPGKLNYGSPGNGGSGHLSMELLKMLVGVDILHVPYKGAAVLPAALSGEIDFLAYTSGTTAPHIRSGKLRALAVGSARRLPGIDAPPAGDTVSGFDSGSWFVMIAPPAMSAALAQRIHAEWNEALRTPEVTKRLTEAYVELLVAAPAETAAFIVKEKARWGEVIRKGGIKAD